MRRLIISAFILLSCAINAAAQGFSAEDNGRFEKAMEYSDNGNADKAIEIYRDMLTRYPDNGTLLYELAYCHVVREDFKTAITLLSQAEASDNPQGMMYALHGNCYEYLRKPEKAVKIYLKGIEKLPGAGCIYLELGSAYANQNHIKDAVATYRQGIKAEPSFTSNYYQAAHLLCHSSEPVWGIVFGEIHELLSPNSKRSEELSKAMYDTYEGHPDLLSLVEKRKTFVAELIENGNDPKCLMPLYRYQQKVMEAGHWEAYNVWLLRCGNESGYSAWLSANEDKFAAFADWFNVNRFNPAD